MIVKVKKMSSSGDEDETLPLSVSNYHFVDEKDELVSFSVLPIQWGVTEKIGGDKPQVFLNGIADNGLQQVFKQVKAWRFDLSDVKPEISVLSKENDWIILQKPRKSFEDVVRSVLIVVNCLHVIKRNPYTSGKYLWSEVFRCLLHLCT
ncbi:protein ENHANCED DOWNY MILDEW 2-like [Cannabis sativa]|uniref:protein ENHANCED DOWNY MILDEW 2-like n=1 Tax=Cannabis sativa TaxID=3483 RepID=UPI0029CA8676|nr:protein ENHANCED DOWNY MILDEW 2-like [Cannabis sativa]